MKKILFFVQFSLFLAFAKEIAYWIPDTTTYRFMTYESSYINETYFSSIISEKSNTYMLQTTGNRPIETQDTKGHIRLEVNGTLFLSNFSIQTECFVIGSTSTVISDMLRKLNISSENATFGEYADISIKKFGDGKQASNYTTTYLFSITYDDALTSVSIGMNDEGCDLPTTYAYWNDGSNWMDGKVPHRSHSVVIPLNSGKIILQNNIKIASITMHSGKLIAENHGCPDGWSASLAGTLQPKCYKLYDYPASYDDADLTCRSTGESFGAYLVQIENEFESELVKRMCRGNPNANSMAYEGGCWIGYKDAYGSGFYNWLDPSGMLDLSFSDWRRRSDWSDRQELANPSSFVNNGDNCVVIVPWQEDPMIKEERSWDEIACTSQRAFVCQRYMKIDRYTIVVGNSQFLGGGLEGGYLKILGSYYFESFVADRAEITTMSHISIDTEAYIKYLYLNDGSTLTISNDVNILPYGYIGEENLYGMQPVVTLNSFTMNFASDCPVVPDIAIDCDNTINANVTSINARFISNNGNILVSPSVEVDLRQGGDISSAHVNVQGADSQLLLGGYSTKLFSYDAFTLTTSHRGYVNGEYFDKILNEESIEHMESSEPNQPYGVYRLKVSDVNGTESNITSCIPYHATMLDMYEILASLDVVQRRGGVTVRRSGEGDYRTNYGYTYRIEIDAPSTADLDTGGLSVSLYCVGIIDCGCAMTRVSSIDSTGQNSCPLEGNSSRIDPNTCAINPGLELRRISSLASTETKGTGKIVATAGAHRFPPRSSVTLGCSGSSKATVGADVISWTTVEAENHGKVILTGTGWEGWDSAVLIFYPSTTKGRGDKELNNAPSFIMTADTFSIQDIGQILTAGPHSNLTIGTGYWNGGIIGGRSTMYITNSLIAAGIGKSLRYTCTLFITPNASFVWSSGNISMSNGANVILEGVFNLNVVSNAQYFGFAELMSLPSYYPYQNLLDVEPNFSKVEYFDDSVAQYLRTGTYKNPLCGDKCSTTPIITIRKNAAMYAVSNCNVTFLSPLYFEDNSVMQLYQGGYLNMQSGGGCGNDVRFAVELYSKIDLSGGQFFMGATCTVTGDGELQGSAGTHDLSFSINTHITITGAIMRWPLSRGTGYSLRFFGGLLIEKEGVLLIEAQETTIVVDGIVELKDNAVIQFPQIGTAAQPSVYDSLDAPDDSPRGNLTSVNTMKWLGGTLSGKASFFASSYLFLGGGEKRIKSLAKLVNMGHAEWDAGDIIMSNQADFVNLGTVQMANGTSLFDANNYFKGTILPIENGGDEFASDFHSWDLDQGGLDYSEYVALRTEYVSRAPVGWTENSQHETW